MKSYVFKTGCWLVLCSAIALLTGCSSFTYESQSWRIAEVSDSSAEVTVRYVGVGATSKDISKRAEKARELIELASDKEPGSPITSKLKNVRRKVYLEGDKIVMEETGTIRNPLSWFEQTGLNVFSWFYDPIDLSLSGRYIVKSGWDDSDVLLATNGRVVDENTYATLLNGRMPLAIGGDTQWRRDEPLSLVDLSERDSMQVIVWPSAARMFYWKFSGPAFNKDWQSLAPEFTDLLEASKKKTSKP